MAHSLETGFVIVPITTALQKLDRADAQAWVLVRVRDDEPVRFGELRRALANCPKCHQGRVLFEIQVVMTPEQAMEYVDVNASDFPKCVLFNQFELVQLAFEGMARDAGFCSASAEVALHNKPCDWELISAEFNDNSEGDVHAEESPIGGDLVEVYPVRTALSRFDNFNADYVFRVVPPLNECTPETLARILEAIRACSDALECKTKLGVTFFSTAINGGSSTHDINELLLSGLLDKQFWNQQLGFERATYRSPHGAFSAP